MRYMFIVQGEGRGHMTQALALADILRRNGHELVEVLLGKSKNKEIPSFFLKKIDTDVKIYDTPSFELGKNKRNINLLKTIIYNTSPKRLKKYMKSVDQIHSRIKKLKPDAVVNFYEILGGITNLRYKENIPFINIGHQFLIRHSDYLYAKNENKGMFFLRLHALLNSVGSTKTLALSFYPMKSSLQDRIEVVPPLIRREVLNVTPETKDYILVYMLNDGYEDEIRSWHKKNPKEKLICFWDKKNAPEVLEVDKNLVFHKINDEKFIKYMAGCKGYISTAGFESICEAFYLGKPVMMIPAHIEQSVNALDAVSTGRGISGDKFDIDKLIDHIAVYKNGDNQFQEWVDSAEEVFMKHLTVFV